MKKLFAFGMALFAAGYVNAQDITISNTSCDPVVVVIYGDDSPCDNWLYLSSNYTVAPMSTLNLSMLPGGTYPQVNWISGNLPSGPSEYFSAIKVFDVASTWADYMITPCLGKTTFKQKGSNCIINGTYTQLSGGSADVSIY
jgi:hypothetical protein